MQHVTFDGSSCGSEGILRWVNFNVLRKSARFAERFLYFASFLVQSSTCQRCSGLPIHCIFLDRLLRVKDVKHVTFDGSVPKESHQLKRFGLISFAYHGASSAPCV